VRLTQARHWLTRFRGCLVRWSGKDSRSVYTAARQTVVVASELCPMGQSYCRALAAEHGLSDRIAIVAALTPEDLESILRRFDRTFILSYCETYEKHLLDLKPVPSLATSDILVECHDFIDPEITSVLISRLQHTHSIRRLEQAARNIPIPHRC
jgi:hypothetical protein